MCLPHQTLDSYTSQRNMPISQKLQDRRIQKLGKLDGQLRLDDGAQSLYGSMGPITGSVMLKYLPYEKIFLKNQGFTMTGNFGQTRNVGLGMSFPKVTEKLVETVPMCGGVTATVMLRGMFRYKTRIVGGGGQGGTHVAVYIHDKELFREQVVLNLGWISASVGDEFTYPFSLQFPHASRMPPPSFHCYMACGVEGILVRMEYQLGLNLLVVGSSPQTEEPWWNGHPSINYEIAQPPPDFSANTLATETYQSKIQTWLLLPPDQQQFELKAKTKARFRPKTMPILALDISCRTSSHSHPGQVLSFNIAIKKNDSDSTAESMPEILLLGIRTKLMAQIKVTDPDRQGEKWVQELKCWNGLPMRLCSQNNYSGTISVDALDQHPSSFSSN
ncbi:hypothetical protein BST61_g2093 [Cercospora zeina]